MMLRDELDEWMTAAPPWLNRILRSHVEALDLLESHEAEAAAMRAALQEAILLLQRAGGHDVSAAPSLLSLALGEEAPSPGAGDVGQPAAVGRMEDALNASAGHSLLEDLRELRARHAQSLAALRDLLAWAADQPGLPSALAERAQAALAPSSAGGA
jgi:hypothetical protein